MSASKQRGTRWPSPSECKGRPGSLEARLWRRVDRGRSDECWEWQGYVNTTGYGQLSAGGGLGLIGAHRAAWIVTRGAIPSGLVVRHRCDNRRCCNPLHLALGTHRQNSQDAKDRGRVAREYALPHCRLSDVAVAEIRAAYRPASIPMTGMRAGGRKRSNAKELAARYGVSENYVGQIVRRAYRREGVQ